MRQIKPESLLVGRAVPSACDVKKLPILPASQLITSSGSSRVARLHRPLKWLRPFARALRLSRAERDHLYALAGLQPPGDRAISDHIPPGVERLLTRMEQSAVAVFAADWRLLWWSSSWAALLGDPSRIAPDDRNIVAKRFPVAGSCPDSAAFPIRSRNSEATDRAIVADLRRASGRYPEDQRLAELIRRTMDGNANFAQLWRDGAVGEHAEDRKTIEHPIVGDVTVDCDVLTAGDTDLKIVTLTAAVGSEDANKIELALASFRSSASRRP